MIIKHASHHNWIKSITAEYIEELGSNNKKYLESTLRKLEGGEISHDITPLTPEIIEWFVPLYQSTINQKTNAKVHDVYATTIGKDSGFNYYSLILYENSKPLGATIFSVRPDMVSIAYRIYPREWENHKLPAKPSLYTEYLIDKHAYELGLKKLSHGRDRNPYGINAHIGLAAFKLSIGCHPVVKKEAETMFLDTDTVTEDIFVIEYPEGGGEAKQGYLIINEDNLEKYQQVLKYPDQIKVETLFRQ